LSEFLSVPDRPVRIAVDAMGGDHAPVEVVRGAIDFLRLSPAQEDAQVILVGDPLLIEAEIAVLAALDETVAEGRVIIQPATQNIAMDEHPMEAVRKKPDSSLVLPVSMVRQGKAEAAFSAGNTGAFMIACMQILERLVSDIRRPAIATFLPNEQGHYSLLVDAGANVDCRPSHLLSFALLGSVYAEKALGIVAPRVGVLANGEEPAKGNELSREAHALLAANPTINFIGNIEGNHFFEGRADVVVCDGFVGNVLLKGAEGIAKLALGLLSHEIHNTTDPVLRAALSRAHTHMSARLDYAEVGGAPLLGVNGVAIIAHGRSNRTAIANGIRQAAGAARSGYVDAVRNALKGAQG
jgi:glycerol-3-phosphate acyltransferase PlsX